MTGPTISIAERCQYLALRAGVGLLNVFDIDDVLSGARGIGSALYRLDRRHRRRAEANIRRCFPGYTAEEAARVAERSMQHFIQLGAEVLFTPRLISFDSWPRRVRMVDLAEPLRLMLDDRPTVLVTGHLGNWELLGYMLATVGLDLDAIARPIDNPLINRWLLDVRQRQGMRVITKWGASDRMARVMEQRGMLAFIGDQNAGYRGMFVPFFGRLASAYKSIGLVAMRYNAPIICGYARRINDRFEYELGATDIIEPEDWADQPDPLYYLTARYTRAIEAMVRLAPEQYLWVHRRWKSRPRHEMKGQPMPAKLREKLEQLPWMTDDLLAELQQPVPDANPR